MAIKRSPVLALAATSLALLATPPARAAKADDADRCEAAKLAATREDLACRLKHQARLLRHGDDADTQRCDVSLGRRFTRAEARYGASCPTTGDGAFMADLDTFVVDTLGSTLSDPGYNPFDRDEPCKKGTTDPDKAEKQLAEYSPECATYLEQCTANAWFYGAGEALAAEFQSRTVEDWFPNGIGNNALLRRALINEKAQLLQQLYDGDDSAVDPRYAKSLSVGFRHRTYIGVYNCQTDFQQGHADTGCPLFGLLHPLSSGQTYLGVVRNVDESESCLAVRSEELGGVAGFADLAQDDFKIGCFPQLDRDTGCGFEIWPWTAALNVFNDWAYVCTQKQPENSFDPAYRPWYEAGKAAFEAGAPSGKAIFKAPYVNYGTGQAIFGTVTPFADATGELAGVVLAIEYMEDELTYQGYLPQCDQNSREWDPTYAYEYPAR